MPDSVLTGTEGDGGIGLLSTGKKMKWFVLHTRRLAFSTYCYCPFLYSLHWSKGKNKPSK